jgi:hypothetical protein
MTDHKAEKAGPRYIVREDPRYPGEGWWQVYDTARPSVPAFVSGRSIYSGHDKDRAQADADWLNDRA